MIEVSSLGTIIRTDLFPDNLNENLADEEILENLDNKFLKKYSSRDVFLFLLTFACGVVLGFLLMKFV